MSYNSLFSGQVLDQLKLIKEIIDEYKKCRRTEQWTSYYGALVLDRLIHMQTAPQNAGCKKESREEGR